jgi:hypothetical protein
MRTTRSFKGEQENSKLRSLVNVTRRLENFGKSHDGRVELEHVLLDNVVLPPRIEDVGLQTRTGRAVVVQTSDT